MFHICECEKTKEYLDKLSTNIGVQKVDGIKSLLGDNYLWSDHQKRNGIRAEFATKIFFIAEIMRCLLHGDKLS